MKFCSVLSLSNESNIATWVLTYRKAILLLISIHKESRELKPLKGILWFGAAMMALCAVVILFTTLHRATALGKINRIEVASAQVR